MSVYDLDVYSTSRAYAWYGRCQNSTMHFQRSGGHARLRVERRGSSSGGGAFYRVEERFTD